MYDSLPQQICCNCLVNLNIAYTFRKQCRKADAILRQMLPPSLSPISENTTENDTAPIPIAFHCCVIRCRRKESSLAKLELHAKNKHAKQRSLNELKRRNKQNFVCPICMIAFSTADALDIHKTHSQEKHTCIACNMTFRLPIHLAKHRAEVCEAFNIPPVSETHQELFVITDLHTPEINESLSRRLLQCVQLGEQLVMRLNEDELRLVQENDCDFLTEFNTSNMQTLGKRVTLFEICKDCSFRTQSHEEMEEHLQNKSCSGFSHVLGLCEIIPPLVECESCGFKTKKLSDLERHQHTWQHYGIRSVECPNYDTAMRKYSFDAKLELLRNQLKQQKKKRELKYHDSKNQLAKRKTKKNSCNGCGYVFSNQFNLQRHINRSCPGATAKKSAVILPVKKTVDGAYQCQFCKVKCLYRNNLNRHLRINCPVLFPNKTLKVNRLGKCCEHCGKRFSTSAGLSEHMKRGCPVYKKAKQEAMLNKRLCQHCNKLFSSLSNLRRHIRRTRCSTGWIKPDAEVDVELVKEEAEDLVGSSDEEMLYCNVCGYSTMDKDDLDDHLENVCIKPEEL